MSSSTDTSCSNTSLSADTSCSNTSSNTSSNTDFNTAFVSVASALGQIFNHPLKNLDLDIDTIVEMTSDKLLSARPPEIPDVEYSQSIIQYADKLSKNKDKLAEHLSNNDIHNYDLSLLNDIKAYIDCRIECFMIIHDTDDIEAIWHLYKTRLGKSIINNCKFEKQESRNVESEPENRVFATQGIPKGKVVTLHPADYYFVGNELYFDKGEPEKTEEEYMKHGCRMEFLALVGNPALTDNSTFLGHMCRETPNSNFNAKDNASNCTFVAFSDYFCAVVSTRAIAAKEEILLPYNSRKKLYN